MPIFFFSTQMSLGEISQFSMDSLGTCLIFLEADSSADEARARGLRLEVGEEDTDLEDFEGLLVLLLLAKLYNSSK